MSRTSMAVSKRDLEMFKTGGDALLVATLKRILKVV